MSKLKTHIKKFLFVYIALIIGFVVFGGFLVAKAGTGYDLRLGRHDGVYHAGDRPAWEYFTFQTDSTIGIGDLIKITIPEGFRVNDDANYLSDYCEINGQAPYSSPPYISYVGDSAVFNIYSSAVINPDDWVTITCDTEWRTYNGWQTATSLILWDPYIAGTYTFGFEGPPGNFGSVDVNILGPDVIPGPERILFADYRAAYSPSTSSDIGFSFLPNNGNELGDAIRIILPPGFETIDDTADLGEDCWLGYGSGGDGYHYPPDGYVDPPISLSHVGGSAVFTAYPLQFDPGTTVELACHHSVITRNPVVADTYTVNYEADTNSWTGSEDVIIEDTAGSGLGDVSATISNTVEGEAPGELSFSFTPYVYIGDETIVSITLPGFTADTIADLIDECSLKANALDVTSATGENSLTLVGSDPKITMTTNTAIYPEDSVTIDCDAGVIDLNPTPEGFYEIDFEGPLGETGWTEIEITDNGAGSIGSDGESFENYETNQETGMFEFGFTLYDGAALSSGSTFDLQIPAGFVYDNDADLTDNCSISDGSTDVLGSGYISQAENKIHLVSNAPIAADSSVTISCDDTILDQNPNGAFAYYTFNLDIHDPNSGFDYSTSYDVLISKTFNLSNSLVNEASGAFEISFILDGISLDSGGSLGINWYRIDTFLADEDADLTDNCTLEDDGLNVLLDIAYLTNDNPAGAVIYLETSAAIAAGSIITLSCDETVLDQNPSIAGPYEFYMDINGPGLEATYSRIFVTHIEESSPGSAQDYSANPATLIELNLPAAGTAQLPAGKNKVILNTDQKLDLTNNLEAGDPDEFVDGKTVGEGFDELTGRALTDIKKVTLEEGAGSDTGEIIISSSGGEEVTMPSPVSFYVEDTWNNQFSPPQPSLHGRIGFTREDAVALGSDTKNILLNAAAKVELSTTNGLPYYSSDNGMSWHTIPACADATTTEPGSLTFPNSCYFENAGATVIWTFHYTTFGRMTHNATMTIENHNPGEATGVVDFSFSSGDEIPVGSQLMFTIPDTFTMGDVADLSSAITFTDDSDPVTISSATLSGNRIRITIGGAVAIAADSLLEVSFDASVFDLNPVNGGQYAIQLMSLDTEGMGISTGYVMANIGNEVSIITTVQEALILTIDNLSIYLNIDPAVNAGRDFSQRSILTGRTNAKDGYKIQAALTDSDTGAAGLYNIDADATLPSGDAIGSENVFGYAGYNGEVSKSQADLLTDAATGTSIFSNSSAALGAIAGGNLQAVAPTNEQKHTVYYMVNVDFLTPAGSYTGTITYTALPTF